MIEEYVFGHESKNSERGSEIKQILIESLGAIRKTEIFDNDFLEKITLVLFSSMEIHKFENNEIEEVSKNNFDEQDFMQGKRTDFVAITPRNEFEKFMDIAIKNKPALEIIFLEGKLTYDEFIAHEIAHNVFDIQYIQKIGEYEKYGNITDVSDSYREKIKNFISPLVKKYYPNIEIEKFTFGRQQIAEIFAMLYERDFCKRSNLNMEVHNGVEGRIAKFFDNPESSLKEFNLNNKKNFTMDYIYEENHILSLIVSPLLEKEYPSFDSRLKVFW